MLAGSHTLWQSWQLCIVSPEPYNDRTPQPTHVTTPSVFGTLVRLQGALRGLGLELVLKFLTPVLSVGNVDACSATGHAERSVRKRIPSSLVAKRWLLALLVVARCAVCAVPFCDCQVARMCCEVPAVLRDLVAAPCCMQLSHLSLL
jgi:hypothetical protein